MYTAYVVLLAGCCLMTASLLYAAVTLWFAATSHTLVLAEERFCAARFGTAWSAYRTRTRRYL